MANHDKMYLEAKQGKKYWKWALKHRDKCLEEVGEDLSQICELPDGGYVANFSENVDWYLWHHCNLDFVQSRLRQQYSDAGPENKLEYVVNTLSSMFVSAEATYHFLQKILECDESLLEWRITENMCMENGENNEI